MTARPLDPPPSAVAAPPGLGVRLGGALRRPLPVAIAAMAVLTAAGWAALGLMVAAEAARGPLGGLGPGMGWLEALAGEGGTAPALASIWAALCRPVLLPGLEAFAPAALLATFAMWTAMVLAMMLPSAGPMIVTYAEIAETASERAEPVISPLVLIAGYVAVWLGVALGVAVAQAGVIALLPPAPDPRVTGLLAAATLVAAGLYQFSTLKHACATVCRRPMPFFLAHWRDTAPGVFGLGLRQGLACVGCCLGLMAVMFAVGTMNVVWMALLGLITTIDKIVTTERFGRVIGGGLIALGVMTALTALGLAGAG